MLRAFFVPHGRRPRLEYWRAAALVPLSTQLAMVIVTLIVSLAHLPMKPIAYEMLALIVIGLWAGFVVAIQRLHDQDMSGWWALIALVPILGSLWYLFWNGLRPGTPGPNRYGPDPLGDTPAAVFGDGPVAQQARRKPPIVSTIVTWTILLAIFALNVLLFQNPNRAERPPRLSAPIVPR